MLAPDSALETLESSASRTLNVRARMMPCRETYCSFITITGVLCQAVIYITYNNPHHLSTDAHLSAAVQSAVGCLLILLVYKPLFFCHLAKHSKQQYMGAVIVMIGYFMSSAYRLPISIGPVLIAAISNNRNDINVSGIHLCGFMSVRLFIAVAVSLAACAIVFVSVLATSTGMSVWGMAESAAVGSAYFTSTLLYMMGIAMLDHAKSFTMHTANIVRAGMLVSTPFLTFLWVMGHLQPGYRAADVVLVDGNEQRLDQSEIVLSVFFTVLDTVLRLVVLSCTIESIKIGELFSFCVYSALSYLVFVVYAMVETSELSMSPFLWAAIIIIVTSVSFVYATRRPARVHSTSSFRMTSSEEIEQSNLFVTDNLDFRCHCYKNSWCLGACWHPRFWCTCSERELVASTRDEYEHSEGDFDDSPDFTSVVPWDPTPSSSRRASAATNGSSDGTGSLPLAELESKLMQQ